MSLSGQMQDFVGNDGEDYSGIVDIAEADLEVSTTGVGVSTTVEGTLTDQDSDSIDVDGELIGAFGEGDVFVGVSVGEVTSDEGTEEFLGVLIATD